MIRALVVDDEELARARLRDLLAGAAGVTVIGEAADGAEAMLRVGELAPDVVFLDIQMPGLSGLDVARRLPPPRPRIVFCTAYDAFAVEAFAQHAVDYLLKPVARERLEAAVARIDRELADKRERARERDEAVRTQAHLMPRGGLRTAGLDCFGACRPARGISGDYFDLLVAGREKAVVTVGDVSGKGEYAGLLAAALQARTQALVARGAGHPAQLLDTINQLTVGTMEGHRYATLFVGLLDAAARTLTYASAGHPAALVLREGEAPRELPSTGPAIGWIADAAFTERTVPLAQGDTLLAYTDGIFETMNASDAELGMAGLVRLAAPLADRPAAAMVSGLLEAVEAFAGGAPPADDRTLVVGRVLRQ